MVSTFSHSLCFCFGLRNAAKGVLYILRPFQLDHQPSELDKERFSVCICNEVLKNSVH